MKKREFIVQDLLSKIYQKQFSEGRLPDQRTLAKMYHVSRFTIQNAIKNLQDIGAVKVIQGSGIYIRQKLQSDPLIFNSLTRTPYERIDSKMLELKKERSTPEDEQIFQLRNSEEIWQFKRIRIVNYKIEQLEISKMPVSLFPDLAKKDIEYSIQRYVEQKGFNISHYITSYEPTAVTKAEADILLCKRGTPAMKINNRCLLKDGRVFEYSKIIAIDYSVTYTRPFDRVIHRGRID